MPAYPWYTAYFYSSVLVLSACDSRRPAAQCQVAVQSPFCTLLPAYDELCRDGGLVQVPDRKLFRQLAESQTKLTIFIDYKRKN